MRTLFDSPNKKKNFGSNSPDLFKNTKQKQLVLDPSCSYSYSPSLGYPQRNAVKFIEKENKERN